MTEFRSKFFFSKFSFFIVRKNEAFFLLLSLMTTSFEKCITITLSLSFSTISSEIKSFFFARRFHSGIFVRCWCWITRKFIKMRNWLKCAKRLTSFWFDCFHIFSISIRSKRHLFCWKHELKKTKNRLNRLMILKNFWKMLLKSRRTWKIRRIYFV